MPTALSLDERQRDAARKRKARAESTDIGTTDEILNVKRRFDCEFDFGLYCQTYLPQVFELDWSSSHLIAIRKIEEALLVGGQFAFAMPRGSGKSSLSRAAVLWAISYSHSRYSFLIGANAAKGEEALDAIKIWLQYSEPIIEDFPEICQAVCALNGVAQRANAQKAGGIPTEIEWTGRRIVLPTMLMPKNHPRYEEGKLAETAGSVIAVSGLDGNGIRGSTFTTTEGRIIRPDFIDIDDPQTDESAKSQTQVSDRLDLINGAVLKMAGPGVKMRAVIPCTIIKQNDLAHQLLDKKANPFWRGEVTRLLESMPEKLEEWDKYFAVYEQCLLADELDVGPANEYYRANREILDEGASHSWPQRVNPDEVSAIQNAMNLYYQDKSSFMAEMQNDPIDDSSNSDLLTIREIQAKQSSYGYEELPDGAGYLTAHIDVHKHLLYYSVVAWRQDFTGHVVDYGTWPDQNRRFFNHRDAEITLERVLGFASEEERIYEALNQLCGEIFAKRYETSEGVRLSPSKVLIDCGYQRDVVEQFCGDSGMYNVQPMGGIGIKARQKPLLESANRDTVIKGHQWVVRPSSKFKRVQWVLADVNYWKTFAHERFRVGHGGHGSLYLYKNNVREHEMFATHMHGETYQDITSDTTGRRVREWDQIPNMDNHYFDTIVGNAVAASMLGCELNNIDMTKIVKKKVKIKRVKFDGFRTAV